MRVLGMRVLTVRVLGRRVPAGCWVPGRRLRRSGGPLLIAASSLLAVAAGSPATGGQSPAGAAPPVLAMLVPPPPGLPPTVDPAGGSSPPAASARRLLPADVLVVSDHPLPAGAAAKVRRLPGVRAAEPVDAARVRVNGSLAAVLGVDPSAFRRFAAKPTAMNTALWINVANGAIAVSYTMGREAKLPAGSTVEIAGQTPETLQVGGLGTVGIPGVDAVVSRAVARSLGFPAGNAIVISAPGARLSALKSRIKAAVPAGTAVELLVTPAARTIGGSPVTAGSAAIGGLLSPAQVAAFLKAALSRVGMPYVWGAAGPAAFDCSGLVQWSLAQAGIAMPRVAADQARTGPAVPISQLQPGDLLFYHFDPTAPGYVSHVAIYLGRGLMLQAPQPGMDVEVVPADLGGGFAGAVAVSPAVAAAAAGNPLG
jgi:cell wall-associated NlpC family hydrolase